MKKNKRDDNYGATEIALIGAILKTAQRNYMIR
jgi:hypothetical protein